MARIKQTLIFKPLAWFGLAGFCLVSLFAAPFITSVISMGPDLSSPTAKITIQELKRLGLDNRLTKKELKELVDYQEENKVSLANVFRNPSWIEKFHLNSNQYKATWYMANPFDVLPEGLQTAIKNREKPFHSRKEVWEWCRANRVPKEWRRALYAALIETTPQNLWRASRGERPYTRNGDFLEPIIVDRGKGILEIRDGHIATDPSIIPLNTEAILIVQVNGVDRLLRVKATDTGAAVRGYHVDLPIHVGPESETMPHTRLPKDKIRNPSVEILIPMG